MTPLKFKSKKDKLFTAITIGIVVFCIGIIIKTGFATGLDKWSVLILLLVCGFLLWSYYGTYYELAQKQIKYNCGPIKGKIEIKEIREVIKGKHFGSA
mgnify:FL=1